MFTVDLTKYHTVNLRKPILLAKSPLINEYRKF